MTDDVERLEEEARRRWGDRWAISITRWADGSTKAFAYHSVRPIRRDEPGSTVERERLWPTDDGFAYERVHVRSSEIVDVLDRDVIKQRIEEAQTQAAIAAGGGNG